MSEACDDYRKDYKVRELVGSDITIAWNRSEGLDRLVRLFALGNPKIIAIYSKGLAIWPGGSKSLSDQITC